MTSERAFTLLEVTVVLAVIAIAAGLALPRLADLGALRVTAGARRLAADVTEARDRALLGGAPVRVLVDVDAGTWHSEPALVSGALPAGVRVRAVTSATVATSGVAVLALSPAGDVLPARVDLADDRGHAARVVIPPGTRRVASVEPR